MKNEYRVKKIGLILGICFCLILSTIPMNKLLPNVINAQTKGIPEKSQSLFEILIHILPIVRN